MEHGDNLAVWIILNDAERMIAASEPLHLVQTETAEIVGAAMSELSNSQLAVFLGFVETGTKFDVPGEITG